MIQETFRTLAHLARSVEFEADGEDVQSVRPACGRQDGPEPSALRSRTSPDTIWIDGHSIPIHRAAGPNGRRIPLLKSMLTTACEMDCNYCSFRAGRAFRRESLTPEELARIFFLVHERGQVEGLFLSTGILNGGVDTQTRLLDTADILRNRLGYQGYLHLKIMPGAERDQVFRGMQLADRISINLEAPNETRLARLAPSKHFADQLLIPFQWVEEIKSSHSASKAWRGRWPSTTTQFVVGPAGESDLELLHTVDRLTRSTGLARAYFEAFRPVPGTPFEARRPEEPKREHRLYQASFLLRDYGFEVEDLHFDPQGRLSLDVDPKTSFARECYADEPVELNRADFHELIRVPGIGPRSARRIASLRSQRTISDLHQLRHLGVLAERAAPYITLGGKRPPFQLHLISPNETDQA